MFPVEEIRKDFPILSRSVNGSELVYLDNAASAQKPSCVIESIGRTYSHEYANVHRGLHYLSNLATENYESVRGKIRGFINAGSDDEIIYTTGSTEGINLVAHSWAMNRLEAGDEIVLTTMEHHANIVPWHFLRERTGVQLRWVDPEADGSLDPERVLAAIGPKTRLVAVTHMSNVLGTIVDVRAIAEGASQRGVPVLADGSQSSVHMGVDVQELGVDFFVLTGHKLYGPSASGALYARRERLKEMRPFKGGGDMIRDVSKDTVSYADAPQGFEAGTPAIVQMIGFGTALDYLSGIGMENIARHEAELRDYAMRRLAERNWISVQGSAPSKGAIFSFTLDGPAHPHDLSTVLDGKGIAVRAGHHCAQPLMGFLGLTATCRASFGLYNTRREVDALMDGLELCRELFS